MHDLNNHCQSLFSGSLNDKVDSNSDDHEPSLVTQEPRVDTHDDTHSLSFIESASSKKAGNKMDKELRADLAEKNFVRSVKRYYRNLFMNETGYMEMQR